MGKINVLSFAVANLIAAGEVVDRPASVIKELLENSIDSGATAITVEIQHGGVTYMRVADNGCGMEADDLPVAIRRHATSKIKNAEDLDGIITLGFRGEALAAIASVSDMRIISKPRGASVGAMLTAKNGNILGVGERACAEGTSVIVENLFANVPARRKFLKKDVTEAMAVNAVVEKIALSKPNIAFKLIIDSNIKLETIGDGNLKNTVYSIFGRDFASRMIEVSLEIEGIRVDGYVGRSDNVRANRNYQNFFINGRYVKSKTACAAIEQAFTSYIPPEKYPCCVLFLTINPAQVDVNVHPAKLEVKFSNEKPIFEAVYYAVRNALEQNVTRPDIEIEMQGERRSRKDNVWATQSLSRSELPIEDIRGSSLRSRQIGISTPPASPMPTEETAQPLADVKGREAGQKKPESTAFATPESRTQQRVAHTDRAAQPAPANEGVKASNSPYVGGVSPSPKKGKAFASLSAAEYVNMYVSARSSESFRSGESISATPPAKSEISSPPKGTQKENASIAQDYRIIGEAFNSYVIVERADRILLIDKHAAHERIIFEQLKQGLQKAAVTTQLLMLPIEVMMTSEEIQTIEQYRAEIEAVGFEFTCARYTASVTAIPEGISTDAVEDMLVVIAERIKSGTGNAGLTRSIVFEKALYQASCKAAIKAGREYTGEHIEWLVKKMMELPDVTFCPHGRPVAMELTKKHIDKQFERC